MRLKIKNPITGEVSGFQLVATLIVFCLGTYMLAAKVNNWPIPEVLDSPIWGIWIISFFFMIIGLIFGGYSFKWFFMVLLFFTTMIAVSVISDFNKSLILGHYNYQYTWVVICETKRIMAKMAEVYFHVFVLFNLAQAGFATGIFEFSEGTSRLPDIKIGGK